MSSGKGARGRGREQIVREKNQGALGVSRRSNKGGEEARGGRRRWLGLARGGTQLLQGEGEEDDRGEEVG